MDPKRRKERKARYQNRIRIGIILLSLFVLLAVTAYFITGYLVWPAGFFIVVGGAYLGAGLWEKRELER